MDCLCAKADITCYFLIFKCAGSRKTLLQTVTVWESGNLTLTTSWHLEQRNLVELRFTQRLERRHVSSPALRCYTQVNKHKLDTFTPPFFNCLCTALFLSLCLCSLYPFLISASPLYMFYHLCVFLSVIVEEVWGHVSLTSSFPLSLSHTHILVFMLHGDQHFDHHWWGPPWGMTKTGIHKCLH